MLRLRDLVAVERLGLEVLSSPDELERELRWVHVTELPDPGPYVRDGELVLTNGLWARRRVKADDWVATVASRGASGIVFGLLEDQPRPPAPVLTACVRHHVPLLTLPIDVPFAALTEQVADLHAAERQRELTDTVSRGHALAQALAEGGDEPRMLELLVRDHALPIALVSRAGEVLSARGVAAEAADATAIAAALDGPRRVEEELADGTVAAVFRVGALVDAEAALVCMKPYAELTRAERSALEQTAGFLTLQLARRQTLQAIESRFAGELLEMLYDPRRAPELPGRLRSFAVEPDSTLATLSAALGAPGPRTAAGADETVSRAVRRFGVASVVTQGSDDIIVIAAWPHGRDRLIDAAEEVSHALRARWPQQQSTVGVGALAEGHGELRRAVVEAREARRSGQRRRRPTAVETYDHVGSHRALLAYHDAGTLSRFSDTVLGAVRRQDTEQRAELEHTLRTFLAHGGRFNETAEVLHVHVNTLRNRLARIEELSGRDLGATEDRVDLFLALHAQATE